MLVLMDKSLFVAGMGKAFLTRLIAIIYRKVHHALNFLRGGALS
jgi:hypothetical protein